MLTVHRTLNSARSCACLAIALTVLGGGRAMSGDGRDGEFRSNETVEPWTHVPTSAADATGALYIASTQNLPDSSITRHDSTHGLRPLSEVFADAALPAGALPEDLAVERHSPTSGTWQLAEARPWYPYEFNWAASGMFHRPLYFEDVNLERYGNSVCPFFQPVLSGARFFATVPMLPYKMTLDPPCECVYSLGYYRPGSCAPNLFYHPPLRAKAALVEAATATAFVFLYH